MNRRGGLEHGFTVLAPPEGSLGGRELRFDLRVQGGLEAVIDDDGRGARFVDSDRHTLVTYRGLVAFDAEGTDLSARMCASDELLSIFVDASGAQYPITVDPVVQEAYLKASNSEEFDAFGSSVDIDGDTIVVGAIGEDSGAVGVNGSQSLNNVTAAGAAYVFVRSGSTWAQQAYLKASNTDSSDCFGYDVAVSGDTIVVSAIDEDRAATGVDGNQADNSAPFAGAAYVFVRNGATWSQQAYLKASNTGASDLFGEDVPISAQGQCRHGYRRRPIRQQRILLGRCLPVRQKRHELDPTGLHQGFECRRR